MRLVNTSVTNEKSEIKDAKAAVNVLGLDEIYNLFLASSLTKVIAQNPLEKEILLHGAQAGLAAAELSYWVFDVSRSEAYMAGLMQNIGAVYMSRVAPQLYSEIVRAQLSNPISAYNNELDVYNTAHTYLGIFISKKWHISASVYKAILLHHDIDFELKTANDQKVRHITALIMAANYVVSSSNGEQYMTQELRDYRNIALHVLKMPDNAMKAATAAVMKWGKSIGLSTGTH
ncbi:HDOD domain-containing protein [Thiomicrorhabdus aquaedulcis]|uniref:HDOD domain-containing protein n=1 Tax=Thiomicrorhabdus aquaedulcis TaxID=2211106 RepID=UPI001E2DCC13|nr:HDOD domain-containing protein [Thiomicrorhabdus aquaedulcis]